MTKIISAITDKKQVFTGRLLIKIVLIKPTPSLQD